MTKFRELANGWVEFVEYCIRREFLFRQRIRLWTEPTPGDARFLVAFRLWLLLLSLTVLLDGLSGSHLKSQGLALSLGMIFAPYVALSILNRSLGVDEHRAINRAIDGAPTWQALSYRLLSLFILLPLLLGSGLLARELSERNQARQLAPIYKLLRQDDRDEAWARLEPMVEDRYWQPEQLALQALVLLRDGGSDDKAKRYLEAAVVREKTSFSKACGSHVSRIARDSCEAYVAQVRIHDQALGKELMTRYCAAFKREFPQPEPETSGCGTPAPILW